MRVNDFFVALAKATRPKLPERYRQFNARSRFTFVQIYYARPSLHYEVWVRGKEKLLEIGLHFEADRATNAELLDYFLSHIFEVKDALGDRVEAEQWTSTWTRVHQLLPYQTLDEDTVRRAAEKLAVMIQTLQPLLEQSPRYRVVRRRAAGKRARSKA
jgi:hypothetical protein